MSDMPAKIRRINQPSTDDFLTTDEAADYLNVKPTVIRNYLAEGKLTTCKFKTYTLLDIKELKDWKDHRSIR